MGKVEIYPPWNHTVQSLSFAHGTCQLLYKRSKKFGLMLFMSFWTFPYETQTSSKLSPDFLCISAFQNSTNLKGQERVSIFCTNVALCSAVNRPHLFFYGWRSSRSLHSVTEQALWVTADKTKNSWHKYKHLDKIVCLVKSPFKKFSKGRAILRINRFKALNAHLQVQLLEWCEHKRIHKLRSLFRGCGS